jgi:hypothetical protein
LTSLEASLRRIVGQLRELNREFALVGGLAVSVWADPRLTRDTDLVVADPSDVTLVDLLFAASGIETEIAADAARLEVLPEFVVPVATVGHLIAMKLLARDDRHRPADADDLHSLSLVATASDWDDAGRAVELIAERGAARGRDLPAALATLRHDGAY